MVLLAHNISVGRQGWPILRCIDLQLSAGQRLILRGPNGIGKTSLLRCCAGLDRPLEGEITHIPAAFCGHQDGIKDQLSVREHLQLWARLHGQQLHEDSLGQWGLLPIHERRGLYLSAGQKRRVALARLSISGRKLWILDEPLAALDAAACDVVMAQLRAHEAAGGASLIAAHGGFPDQEQTLQIDLQQFQRRSP